MRRRCVTISIPSIYVIIQNRILISYTSEQGSTRDRFTQIRDEIIKAMAMVEACIDFGEGEDLEEGVYEQGRYFLSSTFFHR